MGRPNVFLSAACAGALCLFAAEGRARAEGWMMDGSAAVGTGLEGGVPVSSLEWHRARTRLILGFDLRSDEGEKESLGFRAFAELERRAGVGGEVRYARWLSRGFGGFVFATGTITPETLVGAGFGATFVIPFGKRAGFSIEPAFAALPLGSDVPKGSVIFWGTLALGVRVGL